MVKKVRKKLKREGRSLIWFHRKFMLSFSYNYMVQMLNEIVAMQEELETAMENYLNK